jgi:diguanylate cyclase (GGDEF)-like protein
MIGTSDDVAEPRPGRPSGCDVAKVAGILADHNFCKLATVTALDPATIILTSTLMAAAMTIVLFSAYRSFPAEVRGLGHQALGMLLLTASGLLFCAGPLIPETVLLFVANSTMLGAAGMLLIGTQVFYGCKPGWWWLALAWAAGMVCLIGWYVITQDYALRVAVFSTLTLSFYVAQLVLLVRHGERHFSTCFFGALLLLQSLVLLLRLFAALNGAVGTSNGTVQGIFLVTANFMTLMMAVGFMTIATRRLQVVMEHRSNSDPLTGVLNRRGFAAVYCREVALMKRHGQPMTLLSIDLDYFKAINDQHGHAVGDRVLVHAARTTVSALREIDHVARFGGEEFIVLLSRTTADQAKAMAQRIRESLLAARGDNVPEYTVSIGIATQTAPDESLEALMARADAALYRAKAGGRDRSEAA